MKKQFLLAGAGILLVVILFIFGRTSSPLPKAAPTPANITQRFNIQTFISKSLTQLPPAQSAYVNQLSARIRPSISKTEQVAVYDSLANYWKDSIGVFEPYAFYISEAAKLEKSEKKLTFAAQLILGNLRREKDEAKLDWQANEAIALFEKAIMLNPESDDLKIGLGSSYVFGKGRNGDAQQTMKGIQELLTVVRKDSNNMKAQLVLGIGGALSGQYDKAIARLQKVVNQQPDNAEAVAFLADAYAGKGNKTEAIKWYTLSKRLINDPHYTSEVDERIKSLR